MDDAAMVLVIEDDPVIRAVIQGALSDEGLRVEVAGDGQGAFRVADNRRPDLVVLDMMLPDMTGHTVAAELKARWGEGLPIIVVTADGRAAEKAAAVGAVAHVTKPFDVDWLVETVQRQLPRSP
jgi:two-component system OmpR family response regulator